MKRMAIVLFICCFICVFGTADEPIKQLIEFLGGIAPNMDLNLDSFADLTINYTSNLSTSLLVDVKDYSTISKSTPDEGQTVEKIKNKKKVCIDLDLLSIRLNLAASGNFGFSLCPGIKASYIEETELYQYQDIWEDDTGMNQIYLERDNYLSRAIMPMIGTELRFDFSRVLSIITGIYGMPFGYDWLEFSEYDVTTEPDPEAQRDAFYQGDLNAGYSSIGGSIFTRFALNNLPIGSIRLDITGIYKFGTSLTYDKYWDDVDEKYINEIYEANIHRIIINANLLYFMSFLKIQGITPALKIGADIQYIFLDEYLDENFSYMKFDAGIAFKY
jgi:hypothetical protein